MSIFLSILGVIGLLILAIVFVLTVVLTTTYFQERTEGEWYEILVLIIIILSTTGAYGYTVVNLFKWTFHLAT
jgi:hypothetical protein